MHITGVSSTLAFGADYDNITSPGSIPREICFYLQDWDIEANTIVCIEYQREQRSEPGLPPVLEGVESIEVLREWTDQEFLMSD